MPPPSESHESTHQAPTITPTGDPLSQAKHLPILLSPPVAPSPYRPIIPSSARPPATTPTKVPKGRPPSQTKHVPIVPSSPLPLSQYRPIVSSLYAGIFGKPVPSKSSKRPRSCQSCGVQISPYLQRHQHCGPYRANAKSVRRRASVSRGFRSSLDL